MSDRRPRDVDRDVRPRVDVGVDPDRDVDRDARVDREVHVDPDEDVHTRRIIDLAGLERERSRSAGSGTAPRPAGDRPPRRQADTAAWSGEVRRSAEIDVRDRPPRRRRWPVVTTALLLVAVAVTAAVAVVGHQRGLEWRSIALQQRARAETLAARVADADVDVRAARDAVEAAEAAAADAHARQRQTSGRLDISESDVAALESRIAALAGEKARLEDELAIAGQAVRARSWDDAQVEACVDALDAWLAEAPDDGRQESWAGWAARSPVDQAVCAAVQQ